MPLDFIQDPRYGVNELSEAIINIPNHYGLLGSLGLFGEVGINTQSVLIDVKNFGQNNVIGSSASGSPAVNYLRPDTGGMFSLQTFRYALRDSILVDAFMGMRAFGSLYEYDSFDRVLMERMLALHAAHDNTTEYLRWCALRGDVVDPSTGNVLWNSYKLMNEPQKVINWELTSGTGDPIGDATDEVLDYFQQHAFGEQIVGFLMLETPEFHRAFRNNPVFRDGPAKYLGAMPNPWLDTLRGGFEFKGIWHQRHIGMSTFALPNGQRIVDHNIAPGEALILPIGTQQTFRTYYSPADYMECLGTSGQKLYAKTKTMEYDRGIEVETVSQQVNVVLKPRLVVRCTFS